MIQFLDKNFGSSRKIAFPAGPGKVGTPIFRTLRIVFQMGRQSIRFPKRPERLPHFHSKVKVESYAREFLLLQFFLQVSAFPFFVWNRRFPARNYRRLRSCSMKRMIADLNP
ncbi:hypothetical protein CH380_06525 [Leptospira adleri]|uniref:Uncharacterized protein n=1 Tax=Leptospira adleri TaxID=2023186 RepID=A0A2M9YRN1_9LEPT|nr:hypothetical protein CH380_06525 [Leptospira adleri]PJZ62660.1 hypothetical protein CH376_06675 [Leptospira adleri]